MELQSWESDQLQSTDDVDPYAGRNVMHDQPHAGMRYDVLEKIGEEYYLAASFMLLMDARYFADNSATRFNGAYSYIVVDVRKGVLV